MRSIPVVAAAFLLAAPLAAQSPSPAPAPKPSAAPAAAPADTMAVGRKLTQWFYTGQADSLWAHMDAAFQADVGGVPGILEVMDRVATRAGIETEVLSERQFAVAEGITEYRRTAKFTTAPEPIVVRWITDAAGRIVGAGFRPQSQVEN